MEDTKICTKCATEKPVSEFNKKLLSVQHACKICESKQKALYYTKNKEHIKAKNNTYYSKNKEQVKIKNRLYYGKNKKEALSRAASYRKNNKEKIIKTRAKYYANNKQAIVTKASRYITKRIVHDHLFKLVRNLRRRTVLAVKAATSKKSAGTLKLLGCTPEHLKIYLESKFTEGMSWANQGQWHIDHIRPCSSFDLSDPSQQVACFHYTNLQPLWAKDNLKKSNKIITEEVTNVRRD